MNGQMVQPKLLVSLLGFLPECRFDAEPLDFGLYPVSFERAQMIVTGQWYGQPKVLASWGL